MYTFYDLTIECIHSITFYILYNIYTILSSVIKGLLSHNFDINICEIICLYSCEVTDDQVVRAGVSVT